MADTFFAREWDKRRERAEEARVSRVILVRRAGRRLQLTVPYHEDFVVGARELSGRWRERSSCWSFPIVAKRLVMELCARVFSDIPVKGE